MDDGEINPDEDMKTRARKLADDYGWDVTQARKIWSHNKLTHLAHIHPPSPRLVGIELHPGPVHDIRLPLNKEIAPILKDVRAIIEEDIPTADYTFLHGLPDDGSEWWTALHQLWMHHHVAVREADGARWPDGCSTSARKRQRLQSLSGTAPHSSRTHHCH